MRPMTQGMDFAPQQASSGWSSLLPELIRNVAVFLSPNEVACSMRPLCRSTASALNGAQYKTVLLSKWAPHDAYAARWGAPCALRSLSRACQEDLLELTAASGSVQNLELAVARTADRQVTSLALNVALAAARAGQLNVLRWLQGRGCDIKISRNMYAAAASGHLDVCAWLVKQAESTQSASRRRWHDAFEAAAGAGQQEVCAYLLAKDCGACTDGAVYAAATGGHVALMDWLLQLLPVAVAGQAVHGALNVEWLLNAAARGCPLPVLQRLHCGYAEGPGGWWEQQQRKWEEGGGCWDMECITAAAARSSTPCWRAKVVWLQEEKGYPLTHAACGAVIHCRSTDEEALARVTWLRGRGCEQDPDALSNAAGNGFVALIRYLLEEGMLAEAVRIEGMASAQREAAGGGHLACLQALHAAGVDMNPARFLLEAAWGGHLPVVRWLAGLGAPLTAEVAAAAAEAGSLELLRYLHERGCPWDASTCISAVQHGSEEMQDWLAAQGCPTEKV